MKLEKFVQLWNDGAVPLKSVSEASLQEFMNDVVTSFSRQFIEQEEPELTIRMSQMGKPAVELAYQFLMEQTVKKARRPLSQSFIFHFGDYFEALILFLMMEYDVPVNNRQRTVRYKNMEGHIDGTVGRRVIEVKTMSGYYFDRFVNDPDDERGYVTQLNLYLASLENEGIRDASWICFNKQTNQLAVVDLEPDDFYLERAEYIAKHLPKVKTFEDIQAYFEVPELIQNGHKKEVPPSMRYSENLHVFYVYDKYGNPKTEAW